MVSVNNHELVFSTTFLIRKGQSASFAAPAYPNHPFHLEVSGDLSN